MSGSATTAGMVRLGKADTDASQYVGQYVVFRAAGMGILRGKVQRVLPDGRLEVRVAERGYHQIEVSEVRADAAGDSTEYAALQEKLKGLIARGHGSSLAARETRARLKTLEALGAKTRKDNIGKVPAHALSEGHLMAKLDAALNATAQFADASPPARGLGRGLASLAQEAAGARARGGSLIDLPRTAWTVEPEKPAGIPLYTPPIPKWEVTFVDTRRGMTGQISTQEHKKEATARTREEAIAYVRERLEPYYVIKYAIRKDNPKGGSVRYDSTKLDACLGAASRLDASRLLEGHAYHRHTDAELLYIIRDAGAAAKNMQGHSPTAEAKYLDQVNDAASILAARRRNEVQRADADTGPFTVIFKRAGQPNKQTADFESEADYQRWLAGRIGSEAEIFGRKPINRSGPRLDAEPKAGAKAEAEPAEEKELLDLTPGKRIHLGLGAKGGAGFYGEITKVEGGQIHIKNEAGKMYQGPARYASLDSRSAQIDDKAKGDKNAKLDACVSAAGRLDADPKAELQALEKRYAEFWDNNKENTPEAKSIARQMDKLERLVYGASGK